MPLKISELSAEDRARLVVRAGYEYKVLETLGAGEHARTIIAVKNHDKSWIITRIYDDGKAFVCGGSWEENSYDLILPSVESIEFVEVVK